jgi:hypothetical protein
MSATEVIAEIKTLPENERDLVLSYLVADAELREALQLSFGQGASETGKRLARAAKALREDYLGDKELTAFTALDSEPFHAKG